jgi:uncharacterized protein YkwD
MFRRQLLIGAGIAPLLPSLPGKSLAQAMEELEAAEPEHEVHVPPAARVKRGEPVEHEGEELHMPRAVLVKRGGQIELLGDDVHGSLESGIVLVSHTTTTPSSTERQQALRLINNERTRVGLASLTLDSRLSCAAQGHARYMSRAGRCSHTGSGGSTFIQRIEACGYRSWSYLGENVACGHSTWSAAMRGWMNSSGHRANILSRNFRNVGLGRYNHYYVQDFGRL